MSSASHVSGVTTTTRPESERQPPKVASQQQLTGTVAPISATSTSLRDGAHVGWLWKKGGSNYFSRNSWRRRWFRCHRGVLAWYVNDDVEHARTHTITPRGSVGLKGAYSVALSAAEGQLSYVQLASTPQHVQFVLELHTEGIKSIYALSAESEAERQGWVEALNATSEAARSGTPVPVSLTSHPPHASLTGSSLRPPSASSSPRSESPVTPTSPNAQSPRIAMRCSSPLTTLVGVPAAFAAHVASSHSDQPILSSVSIDSIDRSADNSIIYVISVCSGALTWLVRKQYADFTMLHSALVQSRGDAFLRLHHLLLPPNSSTWRSSIVEFRKVGLQSYLTVLNHCADLMSSTHVMHFLGLLVPSSAQLDMEEEARLVKAMSKKERRQEEERQMMLAQVQMEEQNAMEAAAAAAASDRALDAIIPIATAVAEPKVTTTTAAAHTSSSADYSTFYRSLHQRRSIHASHVPDIVTTGDILLVAHQDSTLSRLQRRILNATYDHIGMIVRRPIMSQSRHALCVFESTADGVRCTPLDAVLDSWSTKSRLKHERLASDAHKQRSTETDPRLEQYITVCVRRLKGWQPNRAQLIALDEFVDGSLGGVYSLKGLIFPKQFAAETTHSGEAGAAATSESSAHATASASSGSSTDSFFCSELVACAYRAAGLLPASATSSLSLLPQDFTGPTPNVQLIDGVTLSEEVNVLFHQIALADAVSNTQPPITGTRRSATNNKRSPTMAMMANAAAAAIAHSQSTSISEQLTSESAVMSTGSEV